MYSTPRKDGEMKMKVKEFAEFPSCNQKYIGVAVGFAFRDLEAHSANKLCAARARAMNQMQVNGMVFNRTIKRARLQKIQRVRLCVYVYECAIARVKFTPPECRQRKRVINLHSKFMPHSSIHWCIWIWVGTTVCFIPFSVSFGVRACIQFVYCKLQVTCIGVDVWAHACSACVLNNLCNVIRFYWPCIFAEQILLKCRKIIWVVKE